MRNIMSTRVISAWFGAGLLAIPTIVYGGPAWAQAPAQTANPPMKHVMPAKSVATKQQRETVEQRIEGLHASLKITADEEADWAKVAQVMRDNSAARQKLEAEREARVATSVTAVEHMKNYEEFVAQHLEGLKNLSAAFATLYAQMPAVQKVIADQVFMDAHQDAKGGRR